MCVCVWCVCVCVCVWCVCVCVCVGCVCVCGVCVCVCVGLVGIANELRAGRSGIESRWERDFPPVQTGPGAHPASCTRGTGSFRGVKCGRSVLLTTHPLPVPRSWKSRAIPLPTLWATTGLYRGSLYLDLIYIYIHIHIFTFT